MRVTAYSSNVGAQLLRMASKPFRCTRVPVQWMPWAGGRTPPVRDWIRPCGSHYSNEQIQNARSTPSGTEHHRRCPAAGASGWYFNTGFPVTAAQLAMVTGCGQCTLQAEAGCIVPPAWGASNHRRWVGRQRQYRENAEDRCLMSIRARPARYLPCPGHPATHGSGCRRCVPRQWPRHSRPRWAAAAAVCAVRVQ